MSTFRVIYELEDVSYRVKERGHYAILYPKITESMSNLKMKLKIFVNMY